MMMIVYWYLFSNHYTRECIHVVWEIWAAGASPAGGSSLGTFSCGCPSGGRRTWDLCPLFVPARTGGSRGDHPELSLGPRPPLFTTWGSVAGPGGTPMPGNISGPSQHPGLPS